MNRRYQYFVFVLFDQHYYRANVMGLLLRYAKAVFQLNQLKHVEADVETQTVVIQSLQKEKERLEKNLLEQKFQFKKAQEKLQRELETRNLNLESELSQLRSARDKAETSSDDLVSAIADIRKEHDEYVDLLRNDFEKEIKDLKEQVKALKSRLKSEKIENKRNPKLHSLQEKDLLQDVSKINATHKSHSKNMDLFSQDIDDSITGDQKLQWMKRQNQLLRDEMKKRNGGVKRKENIESDLKPTPKRKRTRPLYSFEKS